MLPELLSPLLLFAGGGVIGTIVTPAGPAPFVGVTSGMSLSAAGRARIDVGVGCAGCSCSVGVEEGSGVRTENSGPGWAVADDSSEVVTVAECRFSVFVFLTSETAVVGDTSMASCDVEDCSTGFATGVICDEEIWFPGFALGICDTVVAGFSVAACEAEDWFRASTFSAWDAVVAETAFCNVVIVVKVGVAVRADGVVAGFCEIEVSTWLFESASAEGTDVVVWACCCTLVVVGVLKPPTTKPP